MQWFRWHIGTTNDPKWRVVASRADTSVANVIAIWASILESASQAENRGTVDGWCTEDIAASLGMDPITVDRVWGAMQGKVLDGQQLTGWAKRQPKREDGSTTRVQRHRALQEEGNALKRTETPSNDPERTKRPEERRGEEIKATTSAGGGSEGKPPKSKKLRLEKPDPKYPHFPTDLCDQLYDAYQVRRGPYPYARFRKEMSLLYLSSDPPFRPHQIIGALEAWGEYVETLDPKQAKFQQCQEFVTDIKRWVEFGAMPRIDDWGLITPRGRLAAGAEV